MNIVMTSSSLDTNDVSCDRFRGFFQNDCGSCRPFSIIQGNLVAEVDMAYSSNLNTKYFSFSSSCFLSRNFFSSLTLIFINCYYSL